jgi:diguanylate cyclase (GGDEF)-like protein
MGDRQQAAPSVLSSDEPASSSDNAWKSRVEDGDRLLLSLWGVGVFILAVTVGWALLGDRLLPREEHKSLMVAAILATAATALFIAAYTRQRSVKVERAYSNHLETLSRRLRDMAYRDSLTGLYNHRFFQEQLSHEVERAQRYGHQLSVLMLDVDRFKQVNDTYGHLMGDTLLNHVARLIAAKIRASDVAARYGGDEFSVILPETEQKKALSVAEKLDKAVSSDRHWQSALLENLGVGISFGVATFPDDGRTADDLLVCADRRLYARKRGRSRLSRQNTKSPPIPVSARSG